MRNKKIKQKSFLIPKKSGKSQFITLVLCTMLSLPFGEGWGGASFANNLSLGGTITIVSGDQISFTIQWDNSWYVASAPNNWDAVWIFVKYKDCATTNWLHAPLSTTGTDHTISGGGGLLSVELPAVNDGNGVFIRRTATGSGNIAVAETVTLKLGVATGSYNFKVFGIEMVNIPQNSFDVGDGASTGTFNGTAITITSEGALTAANLGGTPAAVALSDNSTGTGFPKGYNAFYCMKYEITQEQYVDFLNTLTYDQQATRTMVAPSLMATNWAMGGASRNGIKIMTSGVANTTPAVYACDLNNNGTGAGANYNDASDGQNIPCNYLSWADLTAYLDWACLRPMTELEFEKNCRGIVPRLAGEYIWGSIQITQAKMASGCIGALYTNRGASNEASTASGSGLSAYGYTIWNPSGSCSNNGTCGISNTTTSLGVYPAGSGFRVGFAATGTTNRISAGATYYGVMDMGGNVAEPMVQTNAAGSVFIGSLGNGALTAAGNTDKTVPSGGDWPDYSTASGTILRGGDWYNAASYLQTSTRNQGAASASRTCTQGGRGVR